MSAIKLKSYKPILGRFIIEAAEDLKDFKNFTKKKV